MYYMHVMHTSRKPDLFLAGCMYRLPEDRHCCIPCSSGGLYHRLSQRARCKGKALRRAGKRAADTMAAAWGA